MIQKREAIRHRSTHGGGMKKLTKEMLTERETEAYDRIMKYFLSNYDIEEFVADQLALLKIYQLFYIMPKGEEGDIVPTSEMMRKWAAEEKLTKKSRELQGNTTNITLGVIVERLAKGIDVEVINESGKDEQSD